MDRQVHLKLVTPLKTVFDRQVDMVIARTCDGDIGIMHGHDPCVALLVDGVLRVYLDYAQKDEDVYLVLGGVLTVEDNEVVIASYMAAPPHQIQAMMEEIEAERAANALNEEDEDLSVQRAETAMRRALVHMDVSAFSILKSHGQQNE
jgi:F-type H+-transporting ATPase subunit epsilon